jgi:uncharacterized protein (TIGR03000 family)
MYTVVLMAALTAGSASTGQGLGHGCAGCRGCVGCWGGYPGSGYNYMVGNGYQSAFSVYAPVAGAIGAGAGGASAAGGGASGCTGCYGCYGGMSCYGVALPNHGTWNQAAPGAAPAKTIDKKKIEETPAPKEDKNKDTKNDDQARARLTIDVPVDAKVFLDGQLMTGAVAKRVFQTPVLIAGHTYFYDLRVEIVRDGRTIAETQRVILQPGQMATAAFPKLNQDSAATVPVANRLE